MKSRITKSGHKVIRILAGRSNVFLLTNGEKNVLIDTSPATRWRKLRNRLKENGIDHLEYLILTHSHYDHAGNASGIKNKYNSSIIIQREEANNLKTGIICIPGGTNQLTRFIVKNLAPWFTKGLKCTPCNPDILFDTHLDLRDFGFNAMVIHTPGHSPGSACIIVDDELALAGDTIFGVFRWSTLPPYADNITQLINSWRLLLETNCQIFLPSHGWAKTRGQLQKEFNLQRKVETY